MYNSEQDWKWMQDTDDNSDEVWKVMLELRGRIETLEAASGVRNPKTVMTDQAATPVVTRHAAAKSMGSRLRGFVHRIFFSPPIEFRI
jgi:hypothetical protein